MPAQQHPQQPRGRVPWRERLERRRALLDAVEADYWQLLTDGVRDPRIARLLAVAPAARAAHARTHASRQTSDRTA